MLIGSNSAEKMEKSGEGNCPWRRPHKKWVPRQTSGGVLANEGVSRWEKKLKGAYIDHPVSSGLNWGFS